MQYKKLGQSLAIALAAVTVPFIVERPSQAASFSFNQSGFSDGGTLSGSFEFDETDLAIVGDGFITLGELTSFSADFTGDSLIPDTSFSLGDLTNFAYGFGANLFDFSDDVSLDIEASFLGTDEIDLLVFGDFASGIESSLTDLNTFDESFATGGLSISSDNTVIPEPSTLIISLLISAGVATKRRWQKD